jgi:hypothetical protein
MSARRWRTYLKAPHGKKAQAIAAPGRVDIHRCVVTGTSAGNNGNHGTALLAFGGTVSVDDSLIRASGRTGLAATGLLAFAPGSTSATIKATQLTIVGNASDTGVQAEAQSSGCSVTVNLTDSIIANPIGNAIDASRVAGGGASVTVDYSDLDPARIGHSGGASVTLLAHVVPNYVNPAFANPASDLRLLATSPLLHFDPTALGHTPLGATESATDLSGAPRITGTGRDLGAYQHQPPTVTASVAPASVATGVPAPIHRCRRSEHPPATPSPTRGASMTERRPADRRSSAPSQPRRRIRRLSHSPTRRG